MTLRLRLTLLFAALQGGVLLMVGAMMFGMVTLSMTDQTDSFLSRQADSIARVIRITSSGDFDRQALAALDEWDSTVMIQIWGTDRVLHYSRPPSRGIALDPGGLLSGQSVYRDASSGGQSLRVLTLPLVTQRGPVGMLQVATSLSLIRVTQNALAVMIGLLMLLAMVVSAVMASLVIRKALRPLELITQVAEQITRADDLSRRIPFQGDPHDEVGTLVRVINETLARLEDLFHTQKRFVADVSHELRTPLTVIKGEVSLMRRMNSLDEESMQAVESEVDRLTRMVSDLLVLAQAESGKLALDVRLIELDSLVLEVFQQIRTLAGDRLKVELENILPVQIEGDRDRIKQVLINLAGNAVQYTPAGGSLTFSMSEDREACVVISDNGPGIAEEDLPHIFERFYRAEKSRKRSASTGFGLGLSIDNWIVKNHGGNIEVISRQGVGTSFIVRLPRRQPKENLS